RQGLEERHGATAGARQYIRVLQLLAEHPLARVQAAVEDSLQRDELHAESISARVLRLAEAATHVSASGQDVTPDCQPVLTPLCQYQVPRPDLGRFDQLLTHGESQDD